MIKVTRKTETAKGFDNIVSKIYGVKADLQNIRHLKAWNPHNKEISVLVQPTSQLPKVLINPQSRVSIPTGLFLEFDMSEYRVRISGNTELSEKFGIGITSGILYPKTAEMLNVTLTNYSDTPFNLFDGDIIGNLIIEPVSNLLVKFE